MTRSTRVWLIASAAWLIVVYGNISHNGFGTPTEDFLLYGVLPVLIWLGIRWIRAAKA